jgi:hypothetical protein
MTTIETLRQFRIFEYAIFDLALAFIGIAILAPLLSKLSRKIGLEISLKSWLLLTLPISIVSHILVGEITPMTESFLRPEGHYLLKIITVIVLFWGIKEIKVVKPK